MTTEAVLVGRVMTGFAVAFMIGFERKLRGSPAGDRTFVLVGTGTAALTAVSFKASPQAVAGAITGIGFIGVGVVFHGQGDLVKSLTTAAAIFATPTIGVVVGSGHLLLGAVAGGIVVLTLELRYLPGLGLLDARRYEARFRSDHDPPEKRTGKARNRRGLPDERGGAGRGSDDAPTAGSGPHALAWPLARLVLVPLLVRIGSIAVKCGATVLTVLSSDVPGQCLPPAELRLGAATGCAAGIGCARYGAGAAQPSGAAALTTPMTSSTSAIVAVTAATRARTGSWASPTSRSEVLDRTDSIVWSKRSRMRSDHSASPGVNDRPPVRLRDR